MSPETTQPRTAAGKRTHALGSDGPVGQALIG